MHVKTLGLTLALPLLVAGQALAGSGDRNRDGLPDRWERSHRLSLHLDQARRDQDHDGLDNRGEYRAGMNPRDRDSDDDGVADGRENAGTIASYSGGVLTIALAKGGTLTAKVTDATRIRCRAIATAAADDHGGGGHGGHGGDDTGGHGTEPGDDNGGHGSEPGDDNGRHTTTPAASAPATPATPAAPARPAATTGDGCGSAALTAGRKVREAEVKARGGVAIWKQIKV